MQMSCYKLLQKLRLPLWCQRDVYPTLHGCGRIPAKFDGAGPGFARCECFPARIDSSFLEIDRIGCASIRLNADRLPMRRGEQHRFPEIDRCPKLHCSGIFVVSQLRPQQQTVLSLGDATQIAVQGIQLRRSHSTRPIPVQGIGYCLQLARREIIHRFPYRARWGVQPIAANIGVRAGEPQIRVKAQVQRVTLACRGSERGIPTEERCR